ncbi:MAG: Gfo/Idh/MocA family oxidoreductase [Planctomycetota bacterium]
MRARFNIAVVGCGYWGPNLVRNFQRTHRSRVRYVCDTDPARLEHMTGLYPDVTATRDYQEILADPKVDAVVVATPFRTHHAFAKKAIEKGKHVLVEKPMVASAEEAVELIRLADGAGRVLMVGHTFLYTPAIRKIHGIIKAGELGNLYYVSMQRLNLGLLQKDHNVVWDLAPHDIAILIFLLDEKPSEVTAQGRDNLLKGIHDVAHLTLRFPSGVLVFLHLSWLDPNKVRTATFVGSRKMIVYDDIDPAEKLKIYDKGVDGPAHYDTFAEFQFAYRYGDIVTPRIEGAEPLWEECGHFLDCIEKGTRPLSDGRNGFDVVCVLEAAERSIRHGGRAEPVRYAVLAGGASLSHKPRS